MKTKTKRLLLSGVAAAAIFSSFAVPQVQVGANQFLSLFRVDQLEMVKLTQNDISEIENWVSENGSGTIDLKGIGKLEMSEGAGKAQHFETVEAAEQAGYSVPEAGGLAAERVSVTPPSTITFTLDVEKANQLLTQLGSEHQFEAELDGKPFSVSTFEIIEANYQLKDRYVTYTGTASPEIQVPEGVSIDELRATLLSLPFLPENVKTQLAGMEEIGTTLPVPYVETEGSEAREVRIEGAQGFVIESDQKSSVVWQENGNIQMITSDGKIDADELVSFAEQIN